MKNFQVTDKDTGKKYWVSRSMAIAGFIISEDPRTGEIYFLLERRGEGCPDNIGKLCSICGYLDFDETRKEAVIRETFEEIGYDISNCQIVEWCTNDDPTEERQNVTTRYVVFADYTDILDNMYRKKTINTNTKSRGGEDNEVSEIVFLPFSEIKKLDSTDFAFGHKEIIEKIIEELSCQQELEMPKVRKKVIR